MSRSTFGKLEIALPLALVLPLAPDATLTLLLELLLALFLPIGQRPIPPQALYTQSSSRDLENCFNELSLKW